MAMDKFRIEKIKSSISGKIRFLLQELRTDAPKPYWLTIRTYVTRSTAEIGLKKALEEEKPP